MKGHYIFSALLGIGLLLQGCETLDYTPADLSLIHISEHTRP